MKRGKKSFSEQMITFAWVLIILLTLSAAVFLAILFRYRIIGFGRTLMAYIILTGAVLLLCLILRKWLIEPCEKSRGTFYRFGQGLIYDELFAEEYQLFPEMGQVLERFHNMLDKQSAIQISTKQAEYLALQNQINPHFLYNTLDAIRGDALNAGKADIANITQALSKFFRYTITDVGSLVTLEDELDNAQNYFKIQEYRFGEKIRMVVSLPEGERDILQLQVPKLTFQPVIENAIFHGLEKKTQGGTVTIKAEITADKLYVNISDDGVGILEDALEELNSKLERSSASYVNENKGQGGGIALKNVSRRVKLLFGEEYGLTVFSLVGVGTDVRIVMPLLWSEDMRI